MRNAKVQYGKSPESNLARRKAGGQKSEMLPRTLKARSRPGDTTLQRHASFFDDNGDRGVDVAECRQAVPALSVARIRSFYEGTLFYKLAKEHRRREEYAARGKGRRTGVVPKRTKGASS